MNSFIRDMFGKHFSDFQKFYKVWQKLGFIPKILRINTKSQNKINFGYFRKWYQSTVPWCRNLNFSSFTSVTLIVKNSKGKHNASLLTLWAVCSHFVVACELIEKKPMTESLLYRLAALFTDTLVLLLYFWQSGRSKIYSSRQLPVLPNQQDLNVKGHF